MLNFDSVVGEFFYFFLFNVAAPGNLLLFASECVAV
jgi:hypothetical protein